MEERPKRRRGQRGPGKKEPRTRTAQVRLTETELTRFKALGGAKFLRGLLKEKGK